MKFLATIAVAACLLSHSTTYASSSKHKGYLVKLRPGVLSHQIEALSNLGLRVEKQFVQLSLVEVDKNPFESAASLSQVSALNSLIEYVEPNFIANRAEVVGSDMTDLFNYKMINAPAAWQLTKGSRETVVAVSDTGIWTHPDLNQNIWINEGEVGLDENGRDKSKNKIDDDGNGYVDDHRGWNFVTNTNGTIDDHYHGTHVAGTIGAVGGNKMGITGVSWHTRVMSVKFLDRDGSGTYAGGIGTILYAADNGARVINCSWGGGDYSEALHEAIEYAKTKNVIITAAAGNSGQNADRRPMYPAAYNNENIISVASAYDSKGTLSGFSNWGATSVDIAAPGERVYSTFNPIASQLHRVYYEYLNGTSMAAPHVAGAAALALAVNPDLSWQELKNMILSSGRKLPKLKGKVLSEAMLDAHLLVVAAAKHKGLK